MGQRLGLAYDGTSVYFVVRSRDAAATPVVVGVVNIAGKFSTRPFLAVNLYGKTAGVRTVDP